MSCDQNIIETRICMGFGDLPHRFAQTPFDAIALHCRSNLPGHRKAKSGGAMRCHGGLRGGCRCGRMLAALRGRHHDQCPGDLFAATTQTQEIAAFLERRKSRKTGACWTVRHCCHERAAWTRWKLLRRCTKSQTAAGFADRCERAGLLMQLSDAVFGAALRRTGVCARGHGAGPTRDVRLLLPCGREIHAGACAPARLVDKSVSRGFSVNVSFVVFGCWT